MDFSALDQEMREELTRIGLETISQGKLGVIINFSGVCSQLNLPLPKALYSNMLPGNMSILEYFIRKVKAVGEQAYRRVGKFNSMRRDPILIMIQTNEKNHDIIDAFLVKHKYFNYSGVIEFTTVKNSQTFQF